MEEEENKIVKKVRNFYREQEVTRIHHSSETLNNNELKRENKAKDKTGKGW